GRLTVSTSQPGSQYSTCTHGVVGLQTHGPVIVQLTQCRFTRAVQAGRLPPAALAPTAVAPAGSMVDPRSRLRTSVHGFTRPPGVGESPGGGGWGRRAPWAGGTLGTFGPGAAAAG